MKPIAIDTTFEPIQIIADNDNNNFNISLPEGKYRLQITFLGNVLYLPEDIADLTLTQYIHNEFMPFTEKLIYYLLHYPLAVGSDTYKSQIFDFYFKSVNDTEMVKLNFDLIESRNE